MSIQHPPNPAPGGGECRRCGDPCHHLAGYCARCLARYVHDEDPRPGGGPR